MVYRRGLSRVFHKTDDCCQITKKPARGEAHPVEKIDLGQLDKPRPCKFCYPDAPRIKMARRFCPLCNKTRTRPCAHNGGVRVILAYRTGYVSLFRGPDEPTFRAIWVWPEKAHHYMPIAS